MKTEFKHTKGNWIFKEWEQEGTNFYHIRSEKQFTDLIATIHRWKGHIDKREALANAKLIAAAPDLLNALMAVYQDIELQNAEGGSDELNVLVQNAINKATNAK